MNLFLSTIIALVVVFSVASNSFGKEKEFIVGVEALECYPHYDFSNKKSSFTKDLLELFAQKRGYSFKFESLPVKRLIHYFVSKRLDFKYPDHPEWQTDVKKNVKIIYSKPVIQILGGTFVLPQNKGKGIDLFESLGLVLGFTPFHWGSLIKTRNIKIFESSDIRIIVKQVLMGRVDGADIELSVANYHLNQVNQPDALVLDLSLPHIITSYYFSTIKHPEIIKEFNRFLISDKATINQIKKRHGVLDAAKGLSLARN